MNTSKTMPPTATALDVHKLTARNPGWTSVANKVKQPKAIAHKQLTQARLIKAKNQPKFRAPMQLFSQGQW